MKKKHILRHAVTGICAALLLCAALTGIAADAAGGAQAVVREVGSNNVYLYSSQSLTGATVGKYSRGERLTVTMNGDGSCTVYDTTGNLLGYCSPVDLVEPGTPLFVQVPYLYSADRLGNPVVFDLVDLDLYLSENSSNVYKNVPEGSDEKILLVARCLLSDLEAAATELAKSDIGLWVDAAYRADGSSPVTGMAAYNTGCVLDLVLIQNNAEVNVLPDSLAFLQAKNILQKHGFYLAEGSSYTFGYDDYSGCYGVNINPAELPRIAIG